MSSYSDDSDQRNEIWIVRLRVRYLAKCIQWIVGLADTVNAMVTGV
jgi:hypothetical protein